MFGKVDTKLGEMVRKVTETKILTTNEMTDPNLVVGQVLIVPGAKGDPIATPKPSKKPTPSRSSSGKSRSSGGSTRSTARMEGTGV